MVKRIAILYDFFSEHGGVERIMLFQANSLKKAGYDVTFGFASMDETLKKQRLSGFNVIEYSRLLIKNETLQIIGSLFRDDSIKKFKDFDLIICHSFPASYIALKIKKKYNIPYALHIHHPPQFLYNADLDWAKNSFKRVFSFSVGNIFRSPLRAFDRYCVKNADHYFAECVTVQRIIKETYGIKSIVIFPTINDDFKPQKTSFDYLKKYGITKPFILGSGRIIRQKRFDYLLEAYSRLKDKDKYQLVIAGKTDDNEKKYLLDLAGNLNIKVNILGPVELNDLIKIYSLAKTTVLTCPKEWFGLVPIEAIACGCPVVAWKDNFGPEETVIDGVNGYLAKPYDTFSLSKNIERSLEKSWDKKKLIASVKKFHEDNQSKVLLSNIKKILGE